MMDSDGTVRGHIDYTRLCFQPNDTTQCGDKKKKKKTLKTLNEFIMIMSPFGAEMGKLIRFYEQLALCGRVYSN